MAPKVAAVKAVAVAAETAANRVAPRPSGPDGNGPAHPGGSGGSTPPPRRRGRVVWLAAAIVGLLLVAAIALLVLPDDTDPRVEGGIAEVETPLPPVHGPGVTGGSVSVQDLPGTVTVVNVWATWCEPCKREQPALRALANRYRDRGVTFVGIDYRDDQAKARTWIDDFDVPYPSIYDPNGQTAAQLGFPFLPDTYVVDATGTVRFVSYGETDEAELAGLIDQVLGGSPR